VQFLPVDPVLQSMPNVFSFLKHHIQPVRLPDQKYNIAFVDFLFDFLFCIKPQSDSDPNEEWQEVEFALIVRLSAGLPGNEIPIFRQHHLAITEKPPGGFGMKDPAMCSWE